MAVGPGDDDARSPLRRLTHSDETKFTFDQIQFGSGGCGAQPGTSSPPTCGPTSGEGAPDPACLAGDGTTKGRGAEPQSCRHERVKHMYHANTPRVAI